MRCRGCVPKEMMSVNDSRKFPWLGGLVAALLVAVVLIAAVFNGAMHVINDSATEVADTRYQP